MLASQHNPMMGMGGGMGGMGDMGGMGGMGGAYWNILSCSIYWVPLLKPFWVLFFRPLWVIFLGHFDIFLGYFETYLDLLMHLYLFIKS